MPQSDVQGTSFSPRTGPQRQATTEKWAYFPSLFHRKAFGAPRLASFHLSGDQLEIASETRGASLCGGVRLRFKFRFALNASKLGHEISSYSSGEPKESRSLFILFSIGSGNLNDIINILFRPCCRAVFPCTPDRSQTTGSEADVFSSVVCHRFVCDRPPIVHNRFRGTRPRPPAGSGPKARAEDGCSILGPEPSVGQSLLFGSLDLHNLAPFVMPTGRTGAVGHRDLPAAGASLSGRRSEGTQPVRLPLRRTGVGSLSFGCSHFLFLLQKS